MGLRKQRASTGAGLAFLLGNPVLNPATLLFIGFVLSWQFAVLRLVFGIGLVFVVAHYAGRIWGGSTADPVESTIATAPIEEVGRSPQALAVAWLRSLWVEIYTLLPGYAAMVLLLGGIRAWLFPAALTIHATSLASASGLALFGMLFAIPTAGEVPIVQTLMQHGMGVGPAAALLITLPAISLPSMYIVRGAFPARALWFTAACVILLGIVAAAVAMIAII